MSASDPHDLERFVHAQDPVYDGVLRELRACRKASHWMWFVFPQIAGLGSSAMSRRYAIVSRDEAIAYLAHPVLGARLRECTRLVLACRGHSARDIFGHPDDLKFRSCMTLFAAVAADDVFDAALRALFAGEPDPETLARL